MTLGMDMNVNGFLYVWLELWGQSKCVNIIIIVIATILLITHYSLACPRNRYICVSDDVNSLCFSPSS